MTLLAVENVDFHYAGQDKTLSDVSLQIAPGEVVAVVGPSGCGKSTLLGILAGLMTATAGSVRWQQPGRATEDAPSGRRRSAGPRVSLMFQKDTVLPWRTVEHNVAFGLANLKVPKNERRRTVDELLEMGHLTEFRHAHPKELSGGMRRRLALLMSLSVSPDLLLLDEPFAAVDEPTRVGLHADVLRMVYARGTAVIIVTHDLAEAISLSDRVVLLTARPATVASAHEMPFGHDRDVVTVRATPAYNDIYTRLWELMWNRTPSVQVTA